LLVLTMLMLAATCLLPATDALAQGGPGKGFVRLEPVERGAPPNDHPATIEPDVVRAILASIRFRESTFSAGAPVFDDKELDEIVSSISAALDRAGRDQDVTFAVFGRHGFFGRNSPATATSGRMFVQGGQVNVIIGLAQRRYEDVNLGTTGPVELQPGLRARRVEHTWQLSVAPGTGVVQRDDWLRFDPARVPTAATAAASKPAEPTKPVAAPAPAPALQKPATADPRFEDVRARLKTLERLKAEGLITEEEYRERRRAILQSL
jgi:hypothetical protein